MVLEFVVELVEGAFAQRVIALDQKGAERTLGERFFFALLVNQDAKLHVDVG